MWKKLMKPAKDGSLLIFTLAVMLFAWTWFTETEAEEPKPLPTESYHISEGDSLWKIAEKKSNDSGMNVEQTVDWMMEYNDMDSPLVVTGQSIDVPAEVKGVAGK